MALPLNENLRRCDLTDSSFYMWGERGIVATFFADMHLFASHEDWSSFLCAIEVSNPSFPRHAKAVTAIIEPDFGNKGFGHPDAVLLIETDNARFVLVLEAKRKAYARSCGKVRGQKYYNSTLKGQLELNHILALSLSDYKKEDASLVEPEWITKSPYADGRCEGHRATLMNSVVINSVVRKLSGLCPENYFHIVLTTDLGNPLHDSFHENILPEIYEAAAPSLNVWRVAQKQFGWLNYERLIEVASKLRRPEAPRFNLFAESFGFNLPNMSKRVGTSNACRPKKTMLVYIPTLNSETFLHCSYQGATCKLRDYSKNAEVMPLADQRLSREEVFSIATEVQPAAEESYKNVHFWYHEISRLNTAKLHLGLTFGPKIDEQ